MIPVARQDEPDDFDDEVRKPGLAWLKSHKIPLNKKLPPKTAIEPYWRRCLDALHERYAGACAYLAVFVEREAGGVTVDHYVPKSRRAGLAYEWTNYRLACSSMNGRKSDFEKLIDPFTLKPDTFHLELVTGRIYPNPELSGAALEKATLTIKRLGLDTDGRRLMRVRHYNNYREKGYPAAYLQEYSPFVFAEAKRQGLL